VRYTCKLCLGHEYIDAPAEILGTVADILKRIYFNEGFEKKKKQILIRNSISRSREVVSRLPYLFFPMWCSIGSLIYIVHSIPIFYRNHFRRIGHKPRACISVNSINFF